VTVNSKSVDLEFFAQFREDCGLSRETVLTTSRTAEELYTELDRKYRFRSHKETIRVAVNDSLAPWDTEIRDGDRVVFLTPFGGG
jgi:molybdopterin converting factor small subunit